MKSGKQSQQRGFTLVESLVVMAVVLSISAIAVPKVINAIYNVRLRSSASELSGLLQTARSMAVRDNTSYYVCIGNGGTSTTRAWISTTNSCTSTSSPAATDKQVEFSGNVAVSAPTSAPSGLSSAISFTAPTGALTTAKPAFGGRGLPCYVVSSGRCNTIYTSGGGSSQVVSYMVYLTDTRPAGANGWAAVTISPAGRMQTWMYKGSGTSWGR